MRFWLRFYPPPTTQQQRHPPEGEAEVGHPPPPPPPPPSSATSSPSGWLVFAPKQLLLLAQSTSSRLSWTQITTLIIRLLSSGLLLYKDVEEQAVAVVRQTWPQVLPFCASNLRNECLSR